MDNIQQIIEYNYDFLDVRESNDLNKKQRSLLINEFIRVKPTRELIEGLLEAAQPIEMPELLTQLFSSPEKDLTKFIISKINKSIYEMLRNYYDTEIDELLSSYHWQVQDDRQERMTPTNAKVLRHETEISHGYGMIHPLGAF